MTLFKRFNRKAESLNRRQYLQEIRTKQGLTGISTAPGVGITMEYDFPDEEHLFAFLFVLRQFDSHGDHISLRRIAALHQRLPTAPDLRRRARALSRDLDAYLKKPTKLILGDHQPTRREVFNVLLYGGYAHANDYHEPKFLQWTETEYVRVLTLDEFGEIALGYTQAVFFMRGLNIEALAELEG